MKIRKQITKTCSIITFLMIFTCIASPNSFAQGDSPEYVVRTIHFIPKDIELGRNVDAEMDTLLKDVQQFYADEMERHGFGRKTFKLETDRAGKVVVHHVNGRFGTAHYQSTDPVFVSGKVYPEVLERFDTSKNIYLIVASLDIASGGVGGGNLALVTHEGICDDPVDDYMPLAIHELGHAFGLPHDWRTGGIMSYGFGGHFIRLSKCAAEWLDVHPYFNKNPTNIDTARTTIEMLPSHAYPPNAIRLRFEITDADGLHQAHLIGFPDNNPEENGAGLLACKLLNGRSNTIEFVTTELTLNPDSTVTLSVIDKRGNFTNKAFSIRENEVRDARQNRTDINGDGVTNAADRIPATLRKVSGDNQRGVPNTWLPKPFVVEVLDAKGKPVVGVEVIFRLTPYPIESTPTESIRTDHGYLSDTTPRTDANGRAQSFLYLGYSPEYLSHTLYVSVAGVSEPVHFDTIVSREETLINPSEHPDIYWVDTQSNEFYSPDGTEWIIANFVKDFVFDRSERQLYWIAEDPFADELSCAIIMRNESYGSFPPVEITKLTSTPFGIAVHPGKGKLYWTNTQGNIQTCNLDGSNIQNLITGLNSPKYITVDTLGNKLYWTDGREHIQRADLNGKNVQTFLRSSGTLGNITIAGDHLYWAEKVDEASGNIRRANIRANPKNIRAIVRNVDVPVGVYAADDKLYWTDTAGRIRRANLDGSLIEDVIIGLITPGQLAIAPEKPETDISKSRTLSGHVSRVIDVAFSPDGNKIASADDSGTVRLWNANTGEHIQTLTGHIGWVTSVVFSPDGKRLATGSLDQTVRLWNVNTGMHIRTFRGHTHHVLSVAFSPDGKQIATASDDNTVRLWNVNTGMSIRTFKGHTSSVLSVAFSPDGKQIATGSWDDTVRLWRTNGRHIRTLKRQPDPGYSQAPVFSVAFSPDGKQIATASGFVALQLWNTNTGTIIQTFRSSGQPTSAAFSPDGKIIAAGTYDKMVLLYDTNTGTRIHMLSGHTDTVTSVAFSPDGKRLVTGSDDRTVRLWELEESEPKPKVVQIPDQNLAKAVRTALKLGPNARITDKALETLTHLDARNKQIKNLTGLEHAKALKTLDLDENEITNVGPLTGLKQLEWLLIGGGGNKIGNTGVRRLSDLTRLKGLSLWDSQIGNITPLAKLTKLESLWLDYNEIRDISALSKLVNLRTLHLRDNKIRDGSPLAKLTKLESLRLAGNPIQDYAPLRKLLKQNPDMELDIEVVGVGAAPTAVTQRPAETALLANFPNPFNPETWIPYELAASAEVSIAIYATDGKLVRTLDLGYQAAGYYDSRSRAAYWDGRNGLGEPVASAVYFYTFTAGEFTATRKMLIRK